MKYRCALALGLCVLASGCVTNPNRFEFEGAVVTYEMLEVGAGTYKLNIEGGRGQNKAQVERAYAFRAGQLCDGKGIAGEPEYVPGIAPNRDFLASPRGGYQVTGVVTCPGSRPEATAAVALFRDSVKTTSEKKAEFFFLSKIDDKKIEDSAMRTQSRNHGRGFAMTPVMIERNVPAQPAAFTIVGRAQYAAPILALTTTKRVYDVEGTVKFTPEKHRTYVVRGELGESYSAVWIEEELEGGGSRMIGQKVEQGTRTK